MRGKATDAATKELVRRLYAEGYTSTEVSQKTGLKGRTVSHLCKDIARPSSNSNGYRRTGIKNEYEVRGEVTAVFLRKKSGQVIETLISTSDLPKLINYPNKWYLMNHGYVASCTPGNRRKITMLHSFVKGYQEGMVIDHINRNPLDNRNENLRFVTHRENLQNQGVRKGNKSGVRGVGLIHGKYRVRLMINGNMLHFGTYNTLEEAESVAKRARQQHFHYSVDI